MRIEVEPQQLIDAGKQVGSLGAQLGALSDAMGQALSAGIASGTDPAGLNFGISYGRQADEFGKQLAQLANAFKSVGQMLEATGFNYKSADAASTPGGPGPSGGVSGEQPETKAGDAPYGPSGSLVTPPTKWYLITPFLRMIPIFGMAAGGAMTWPTGNSSMMNLTAAQWANIGRGLGVFAPALTGAAMAAGAQDVPEVEQIKKALKDLGDGATKLASFAAQMATAITDFARGVQETQDAIRDLLNRISLDGLWDTVTGILSGDGDRVLREIADDVGTVLENFQNQVKGVLGLLEELKTLLGEASDSFEKWVRPILVETFGEEHGNFLANAIDFYTDVQVGGAAAVIGLVSGTVALADPDTWKGLADTAMMIAKDPTKIDDVLKQVGSEFIALDEWQGDNPGRGLGEATGNIASLFLPGGALAKGGAVAKGLAATRHLLDGGSLGGLSRLPGLGGNRTPDMPDLPDAPDAPNIPEFTPPPAIPGSVLGPGAPSTPTPTAPTSPGSGNAPTGPSSNGSGPSSSGGGAGPGSPSSSGPAPTGGSPSPGGSSGGPSSNGPVPVGGSPSPSGGDGPSKPSGGAPVSPSISSSGESSGPSGAGQSPSGPSPAGGGDGPGSPSSSGGTSSSGDGSSNRSSNGSGPDASGGTHGAENPSSTSNGGGSDPDVTQKPDAPDAESGGQPSSSGPHDGGANPPHTGDDGSFRPGDEGRIYTMSDGSPHQTSFAPEQLGDNQRVYDALERHGVSRDDFIDLVNRPIDSLSPDERSLITAVRDDLPAPQLDTVMQKVIPPGSFGADGTFKPGGAESYLEGAYAADGMRGAVTIADDTSHLGTPGAIHDGLRLDYDSTPFTPNDANAHVIRFQADPSSVASYDVPRHSSMGGSGDYDGWGAPFTGNGFTKAGDDVVPEYGANDIRMRDGAEMWEVLDDGTQRLVAVLQLDDAGNAKWLRQGDPYE